MKYAVIACLLLASGCTYQTKYGDCIGLVEKKEPHKTYELSYWNIFVSMVFSETIIVPVVVVLKAAACPTGEAK